MATVNLDKSEYDNLVAATEQARQETLAVRRELEVERSKSTDERLAAATTYIEASKVVIDYAVANLSPEFSRNWPAGALETLAEHVAVIGKVTQRDRERAEIWSAFCADISKYELQRAQRGMDTPTAIDDVDDPAIRKMHADIARGLNGGILVKDTGSTKISWKDVALVITLCGVVFLLIKLFFMPA